MLRPQPSGEHGDAVPAHAAAGGAGDAAAHGHVCEERVLRGGARTRSTRQAPREEARQHPHHYGQWQTSTIISIWVSYHINQGFFYQKCVDGR